MPNALYTYLDGDPVLLLLLQSMETTLLVYSPPQMA